MGRSAILAAVFLFACVGTARSQQADGNLEGRVLSEQGRPLPDASVTVLGPSLQGARGAISDRDGYFHIFALPVGLYTVRFEHVAHRPAAYEEVLVQLGKTTTKSLVFGKQGTQMF